MCLWGLIHGRRFVNTVQQTSFGANVLTKILNADGRRVALNLTCGNVAGGAAADTVQIFLSGNTTQVPSMFLNHDNPNKTLRIEDWGSLLLGEVWAITSIAGGATVVCVDTLTNESDDQLAMRLTG